MRSSRTGYERRWKKSRPFGRRAPERAARASRDERGGRPDDIRLNPPQPLSAVRPAKDVGAGRTIVSAATGSFAASSARRGGSTRAIDFRTGRGDEAIVRLAEGDPQSSYAFVICWST